MLNVNRDIVIINTLKQALTYHNSTKHSFKAYAPGPGYLDWALQPDPFRRYTGVPLIELEQVVPTDMPGYDDIFSSSAFPQASSLNHHTISQLFFDSLALSAWKYAGDTRWALRVNASSGNLHPTEGYLVCGPVDGLCTQPMVAHYAPKEHGLEVRLTFDADRWEKLCAGFPPDTFFIGLNSIHWREAWKYGKRAYRYCMHDAGHALGAISIAAAGLGWHTRLLDEIGTEELSCLLGTSHPHNGTHEAEIEEPDMLIACIPGPLATSPLSIAEDVLHSFTELDWQGVANTLSPSQVNWEIEDIASLVRKPHGMPAFDSLNHAPQSYLPPPREVSLRKMIRQRRSAVAMDGETCISSDTFYRMLDRTLAVTGRVPFDTLPWKSKLHLVVMVHRVDDVPPGLYLLVRDPTQADVLQAALTQADPWRKPPGCPQSLPLYCMLERDTRNAAQAISCHQDIASDGCFSLAMLAAFRDPLQRYGAWMYPRLFWEAGIIGQLLYLEAEAAGVRSTGIGCYFDDAMHEVLGLEDDTFQDLYHFTIGGPVEDTRLTILPAYEDKRDL